MTLFGIKPERFAWSKFLFITAYHLVLLVGLPVYFLYNTPSVTLIATTVGLFLACGLSITAGYHRYYSHRSYEQSRWVEVPMLIFGTMAVEGSVFEWCHNHRLHHRYSDTEKDPYNVNQGLLHAHLLWMFEKIDKNFEKVVPDLVEDPLLRFQHQYCPYFTFGLNGLAVLGVGWWTGDYLGAFLILFVLRMAVTHHFTWTINSFAHYWGARPFSKEETAVNNFLISLFSFGEGYHNFHHAFSSDYRNGAHWYQFDPSKWIIWTLEKVNLTSNLNRVHETTIRKKILTEDRRQMLEELKSAGHSRAKELREKVDELYEKLNKKIQKLEKVSGEKKEQYREKFRETWNEWVRLTEIVLNNSLDNAEIT